MTRALRGSGRTKVKERRSECRRYSVTDSLARSRDSGLGTRDWRETLRVPESPSPESRVPSPAYDPANAGPRLHAGFRPPPASRISGGRSGAGEESGADRGNLPAARPRARHPRHAADSRPLERGLGPTSSGARLLRRAVLDAPALSRKADAESR